MSLNLRRLSTERHTFLSPQKACPDPHCPPTPTLPRASPPCCGPSISHTPLPLPLDPSVELRAPGSQCCPASSPQSILCHSFCSDSLPKGELRVSDFSPCVHFHITDVYPVSFQNGFQVCLALSLLCRATASHIQGVPGLRADVPTPSLGSGYVFTPSLMPPSFLSRPILQFADGPSSHSSPRPYPTCCLPGTGASSNHNLLAQGN